MILHYSQTASVPTVYLQLVLTTYDFTLLSNNDRSRRFEQGVLTTYDFTLLSNGYCVVIFNYHVLTTYDFTLLSNQPYTALLSYLVLTTYDFTLLSNRRYSINDYRSVLTTYDFTLLSNLKLQNPRINVYKHCKIIHYQLYHSTTIIINNYLILSFKYFSVFYTKQNYFFCSCLFFNYLPLLV